MTSYSARFLNGISNPSTVAASWNSSIRAAVNRGCCREALHLYRRMKRSGARPTNLTFPFVVKACSGLSDGRSRQAVHTHLVKSPFRSDVFVQTALVDMYVKCCELDAAHSLFERMPERDVAAWNVMLMGFSQLGCLDRVLVLFRRMRLEGIMPDSITIISLSQSCACEKSVRLTKSVHCFGIRIGVEADVSVANTWISVYAKCGDLVSAESVFNGISTTTRTVVSWNSMITGYAHLERSVEVVTCFLQMCRDGGVRPDLSTIVNLLSSFAHSETPLEGKIVHCLAIRTGFASDVTVVNTLISLYSKCGDVDVARYCFDTMPRRTCVSWTAMIGGYAQKGDIDGAMDLFYAMEDAGEKPDAVTVVAVLTACSQTGALELGRSIDRYAVANGFQEEIMVSNALVDMYAKCGSIVAARRLFDRMPTRTIVSWTTMISGYATNGDFGEAVGIFTQMVGVGMEPNHVTFLAVLQACTHAGFLEEGLEYFDLMVRVHRITPRLEHYACIVDLLGRRGEVKQALEFVKNMSVEPDAGVWGALLGACLTHNEIEVGEYAAHRLFEIEPRGAVSYVAMANIYASERRWEGVARIRAAMKQKGVRKSPGQSLVQVNGRAHAFTVEDGEHPEGFHIYEVLHGLALHLKAADHEMDTECILANELE